MKISESVSPAWDPTCLARHTHTCTIANADALYGWGTETIMALTTSSGASQLAVSFALKSTTLNPVSTASLSIGVALEIRFGFDM